MGNPLSQLRVRLILGSLLFLLGLTGAVVIVVRGVTPADIESPKIPFARELERAWLPSPQKIEEAVRLTLAYRS